MLTRSPAVRGYRVEARESPVERRLPSPNRAHASALLPRARRRRLRASDRPHSVKQSVAFVKFFRVNLSWVAAAALRRVPEAAGNLPKIVVSRLAAKSEFESVQACVCHASARFEWRPFPPFRNVPRCSCFRLEAPGRPVAWRLPLTCRGHAGEHSCCPGARRRRRRASGRPPSL